MPSAKNNTVDVIIAGGGMVGAVLALALARAGKSVACVDPVSIADAAEREASSSFDRRATACAISSIHLFQQLDLWSSIKSSAAAIENIHVSKQGAWGRSRLAAADIQQPAFGYVVPNLAIAKALNEAWCLPLAGELRGFWGLSVASAATSANGVTVELSDQSQLAGKLLVVADGGRSQLRQQLAVASSTIALGQQALVCNLSFQRPQKGVAFERFTAGGPLALLPLGGQDYNLVWCSDGERNKALMAMAESEFSQALLAAFGNALGPVAQVGQRQSFGLDKVAADSLVGQRFVVLGNAAQALHPVAGQGFNLGLRDVGSLYDLITPLSDSGSAAALSRYPAMRALDRQQMLALTQQLATATRLKSKAAVTGFGMALAAFNQWPAASRALAYRASGLQPQLPSLCQRPVEQQLLESRNA